MTTSKEEKVKDVHWEGDTVYGKVKGTEEYNVSVEIDSENVGKLSCDCPYAKGQKSVNIWLLYYLKY